MKRFIWELRIFHVDTAIRSSCSKATVSPMKELIQRKSPLNVVTATVGFLIEKPVRIMSGLMKAKDCIDVGIVSRNLSRVSNAVGTRDRIIPIVCLNVGMKTR